MGANQSSKQLEFAGPIEHKNYSSSSIRSTKSHLRSLRKGMSNLLNNSSTNNSNADIDPANQLQQANDSPRAAERHKFFPETKSNRLLANAGAANHNEMYLVSQQPRNINNNKLDSSEMMKCNIGQSQQQFASLGRRTATTTKQLSNCDFLPTQKAAEQTRTLFNDVADQQQRAGHKFAQNQQMQHQLQQQRHKPMNDCNYDAMTPNNGNNKTTSTSTSSTSRQTNCNSFAQLANGNNREQQQISFTSPAVQRQTLWLPQTTTDRSIVVVDGDEQNNAESVKRHQQEQTNAFHQLNSTASDSHNNQRRHHPQQQQQQQHHVATTKTTGRRRENGPAVVMPPKVHEKLDQHHATNGSPFASESNQPNVELNLSSSSASQQLLSPNNDSHHPKHHQRASSESWSNSTPGLQRLMVVDATTAANHNNNNNIDFYHQKVATYGNNNNLDGSFDRNFASNHNDDDEYEENPADSSLYYDDSASQQPVDFDLEHYYSRNLHLLDASSEQQQQQAAQFYPPVFGQHQAYQFNYPNGGGGGHLSAPLQRRYKWPKQQYQYLNSQHPTCIDYFDYNQPLANDLSSTSSSASKTHKRRKSRGSKSITNPLAAIFQQPQSQAVSNTYNFNHYSNTISGNYLSSSKSQQTLSSASSTSQLRSHQQAAAGGGGSLKRIKSTPLSAQQASYEAMRTIDMYLIRQIARNCRMQIVLVHPSLYRERNLRVLNEVIKDQLELNLDFELEQKIDLEIRLRELAAQSMLEARNEIDLLEVEKSLLTSDQRMNCYASQLEEQRKQLSNPSLSTDSGRGSKVGLNSGSNNQLQQHHRQHHQTNSQSASSDSVDNTQTNSHRSDVIGQQPAPPSTIGSTTNGNDNTTSSPSFGGSSSNSQSPSKLSPVSGESANSPPSFSSGRNSNQTSRSRVNMRTNSSNSANNTLSRRQRIEHKRREQLMQKITSLSNINCNIVSNNLASLSISELRIPLMWRDVDHFKNRGDYKRYAVFCLLKIDSQIYDTQLISDVDRQLTDLTFDDLIVFNDVGYEFELTLEVYSCVYLEQFSLSSTPRKLKEKLSSSVSRAMGRRLATQTASASYTKELQAYDKSYRFAMIASAKLRLDDASDSVKTYDLVLVTPSAHNRHSTAGSTHSTSYSSSSNNNNNYPINSNGNQTFAATTTSNQKDAQRNTLPLFGHFCCKLLVRPDVFDKNVKTGYLRVANINLTSSLAAISKNHNNTMETTPSRRQSSDSPNGCSSSASTSGDSTTNDSTMLRSALAASSKLANLSMANSTVHWALLRNFVLHLWPIDEQKLELALIRGHAPQVDVSRKPPFSVTIDRYTKLLRVSNTSLTIETDRGCFVLAVYNPETSTRSNMSSTLALAANQHDEISQWLRAIEQSVYDSHIWGSVLNHYPPKQQSPRGIRSSESNGISMTRMSNLNDYNDLASSKQRNHHRSSHNNNNVLQADL